MNRIVSALFGAALLCAPAFGHGGGGGGGHGGGGHGGGHYTYVPVFISRAVPSLTPAQIANYKRIRTVGILSAVGGKLYLFKHNGFLNNDTDTRDITGWNLDGVITARLHELLSSRFNLVDIPADHATIAAAIDPGLFINNKDPLRDYLRKLNRSDLDAYLIVRPVLGYDLAIGTPGLGADLSQASLTRIAANYEIDLVDAKSFEVIASAQSRLRFSAGMPEDFPIAVMPGRMSVGAKLSIADSSMQKLKNGIMVLMRLSELETVRAMQFGVTLPRPGDRVLVPVAPNNQPLPGIKTVAVISDLGDQMTLTYRKPLWQHGTIAVPTPGWTLDSQVEAMVASSLDKRFIVKPVTIDRAGLTNLAALSQGANVKAAGLPASPQVDAYIFVVKRMAPVASQLPFPGGLDPAGGTGLWHFTIGDDQTAVFANYSIVVIDAHTGKPMALADGAGSAQSTDPLVQTPMADSIWPEKGALTPGNDAIVRKAISDLMADSIPETLLHAGLTGMVEIVPPPVPTTASTVP